MALNVYLYFVTAVDDSRLETLRSRKDGIKVSTLSEESGVPEEELQKQASRIIHR